MKTDSNPDTAPAGSLDNGLLEAMMQGDATALPKFYERHAKRIYSVALRVLNDSGAAEDVLQEIFIHIWRNPADFITTRGNLEGWLAVVARNRAIDVIRRRKTLALIDDFPIASTQDVAAEVEESVTLDRVKHYVHLLPPEQRTTLEMAFFQGLTHSEIAKQTGEPLGTVKTRIRVALQTLKKALRQGK